MKSQDCSSAPSSNCLRYVVVVLLFSCCCLFSPLSAYQPDSSLTTEEPSTMLPSTNITYACSDLPFSRQRELCHHTTGLLQVLIYAEIDARDQCAIHFRHHKWNCYDMNMLSPSNLTMTTTPESAFVRSIMAASIARHVAKACTRGDMECTCATNVTIPTSSTVTIVEGCSDNLDFGIEIAQIFMDDMEIPFISDKKMFHHHNNHAGLELLREATDLNQLDCKCHGITAGCTIQTCRKVVPELGLVAAMLKAKYDEVCKAKVTVLEQESRLVSVCERRLTRSDLIYGTPSPDFCFRDLTMGSPGVSGRVCELDGTGENSCENLCCDRGQVEEEVRIEENCCEFVWCCRIECNPCVEIETIHKCL